MKKTITLCMVLLALCTRAFATDYLTEDNGYLLHYFQQSGLPSEVYLNCEKDIITGNSSQDLTFTFGGNLSWYNLRARFLSCWYMFSFGKFDIHYKLYYKMAGEKQYKLATEGSEFFVDEHIKEHEPQEISYKRTIAYMNKPFEYTIKWSFPQGIKTGVYHFKIELSVSPNDAQPTTEYTVGKHFENGATNIFCKYESAYKYITNDGGIVHYIDSETNQTGGKATIHYVNSNRSVIYGNADRNPINSEGYRLVYNHPNAEFVLNLASQNTPADTIINNIRYDGYTHFMCGIGENYQLPSLNEVLGEFKNCINDQSLMYRTDLRYIDYVKLTQKSIYDFLKIKFNNKEYIDGVNNIDITPSNYGIFRYKSALPQTINEQATLFNENTISKLSNHEKQSDKWFSRIYHVRDLDFVKLPKTTITGNMVFKVWNKMLYTNKKVTDITTALGCSYYGPSSEHMQQFGCNYENYPYNYMGENCIMFKLLPQVNFPKLSNEEKSDQYICADNDSSAVIHLKGKSIQCENTSPTLYNPLYLWQVSENLTSWQTIDDSNTHRILTFDAENYQGIDSKDILLKPSILKKNRPLYFRQICVLKSFASTEESNLYNFAITTNNTTKYYISVASEDYYTYRVMPHILDQNFAFLGEDWKNTTYVCQNEKLENRLVQFSITEGYNLSKEQVQVLDRYVHYKVYEIDSLGGKKLVSNTNKYLIPQGVDSIQLECAILTCSDSIGKEIQVYQYPMEYIQLQNITSSAAINKRDSLHQTLYLSCLQGLSPTLTLNENSTGSTFLIRRIANLQTPHLIDHPWDMLNRGACYEVYAENGWNFTSDTGLDLDDATLSQLREYGKQKQWLQNEERKQTAISDSINDNTWKEFSQSDGISTLLPYREEVQNPVFCLQEINQNGCKSDSIFVKLEYVVPISGNQISFKNTQSDTVFVPSGESNPYIMGSYPVTGGYGPVNETNGTTYTYQWMRKSSNNEWEPIVIGTRYYAQVTDDGSKTINSGTKYISLPEETLKDIQEKWEIARFVYSRKHGDENSQLVSISNSLWMFSTKRLNEEHVQVYEGDCPKEKISVVVNEPDDLITKNTRYCWNVSDKNLILATSSSNFSNTENKCTIKDAKKDFVVTVYRYDIKTGIKSNAVEIPVNISKFNSGFSILYNNYEYDIDETLVVSPGSKIQLLNQSANAQENLNVWVLQVQDNLLGDGKEIDGCTSHVTHPSCYLYNIGQNKIKLTTTSPKGCKETIVAENLYVQGVNNRAINSYFENNSIESDDTMWVQNVWPTWLNSQNQYTLSITTNKTDYPIALFSLTGQCFLPLYRADGNQQLELSWLPQGTYLLHVDKQVYKLIKN